MEAADRRRDVMIELRPTDFIEACLSLRNLSQNTVRAYAQDVRAFKKFLATLESPTLDQLAIREYARWLRENGQLQVTSIRRRLAGLRTYCRWALEEGHINTDPFHGVRLSLRAPVSLPRILSKKEIRTLLLHAEQELGSPRPSRETPAMGRIPWRTGACFVTLLALELLLATGLRVGELVSVSAGDIDLDEQTIRVNGKGNRQRRVFLMDPRLVELLRRRLSKCASSPDPLLVARGDRRMTEATMRRRLHRLSERAGIKRRLTPHMFRHTAATLLLENGVDIRFVQRLLGHASIAMTERYTAVADASLRTLVSRANIRERVFCAEDTVVAVATVER
jgi:integrase/recombinase XerD